MIGSFHTCKINSNARLITFLTEVVGNEPRFRVTFLNFVRQLL